MNLLHRLRAWRQRFTAASALSLGLELAGVGLILVAVWAAVVPELAIGLAGVALIRYAHLLDIR